jgi:hypothetical protein
MVPGGLVARGCWGGYISTSRLMDPHLVQARLPLVAPHRVGGDEHDEADDPDGHMRKGEGGVLEPWGWGW